MPYHVLIVEDDASLRQLYGLYLERGQFDYTAVASGEEALKEIVKHPVDIILVDVNLNGDMNGIELIKVIQQDNRYQAIKIVTLTSFPERFNLSGTIRIDLALNKPIKYASLISSLYALLEDQTE